MSYPLSKNFLFWHRYVDDMFSCLLGTRKQLENFSNYVKTLHKNIYFTIELEENIIINFL